jgi:hypothetical protein
MENVMSLSVTTDPPRPRRLRRPRETRSSTSGDGQRFSGRLKMLRVARDEQATGGKLDFLRTMIIVAFLAGMASGLLLAIAWDATFTGQRRPVIEADIIAKESPRAGQEAY